MRCRKVRSLLSAACSEELGSRHQAAVREHLASCASCRTEASYHKSIRQAAAEIERPALSDDFNTRLLNRLAEERFAETRTRAYMPKKAPSYRWGLLAPVVTAVALVVVVALNFYTPNQPTLMSPAVASVPGTAGYIDDDYLRVQPTNNPNLTANLQAGWTLQQQLARAERLDQISRGLTNQNGFGNMHLTGSRPSYGNRMTTFGPIVVGNSNGFRIILNGNSGGREDVQSY